MDSSKKLPMTLLPKAPGLKLRDVAINTEMFSLSVESACPSVACPVCGQATARPHSEWKRGDGERRDARALSAAKSALTR
jgi:hypothetical protein